MGFLQRLRGRFGEPERREFQSLSGFWWGFCGRENFSPSVVQRRFNPFQGFGGVSAQSSKPSFVKYDYWFQSLSGFWWGFCAVCAKPLLDGCQKSISADPHHRPHFAPPRTSSQRAKDRFKASSHQPRADRQGPRCHGDPRYPPKGSYSPVKDLPHPSLRRSRLPLKGLRVYRFSQVNNCLLKNLNEVRSQSPSGLVGLFDLAMGFVVIFEFLSRNPLRGSSGFSTAASGNGVAMRTSELDLQAVPRFSPFIAAFIPRIP